MPKLVIIIISAVLVNNFVLARFLGLCPFMGVSRNLEAATGMSMATAFVLTLSSATSYLLHEYLLVPLDLEYLRTISFILVIAASVQFTEIMVRRLSPLLDQVLGIFIPLIATNCAVLGVALLNVQEQHNLLQSALYGFGAAAGFGLVLEGRHYRPFFEYWTIWGAFSPVAYSEGRGMLTWSSPKAGLSFEVGGGYRDYDETNAGVDFVEMKEDGWRLYGGGHWVNGPWFVDGGYRSETGFGASRYGGDLTVGRLIGNNARLALFGSSTKTFGEFRIGEQLGSGGGINGSWNLSTFTVSGSAGLYRITFDNRPQNEAWTQPRAHLSIAWRFGSTPTPRPSMRGIGGY